MAKSKAKAKKKRSSLPPEDDPQSKGKPGNEGIGMVFPAHTMFLRESIITATDKLGETYEISLNQMGRVMLVESSRTGKYFLLRHEDLVYLAIQAGIDEEDTDGIGDESAQPVAQPHDSDRGDLPGS